MVSDETSDTLSDKLKEPQEYPAAADPPRCRLQTTDKGLADDDDDGWLSSEDDEADEETALGAKEIFDDLPVLIYLSPSALMQ